MRPRRRPKHAGGHLPSVARGASGRRRRRRCCREGRLPRYKRHHMHTQPAAAHLTFGRVAVGPDGKRELGWARRAARTVCVHGRLSSLARAGEGLPRTKLLPRPRPRPRPRTSECPNAPPPSLRLSCVRWRYAEEPHPCSGLTSLHARTHPAKMTQALPAIVTLLSEAVPHKLRAAAARMLRCYVYTNDMHLFAVRAAACLLCPPALGSRVSCSSAWPCRALWNYCAECVRLTAN